MNNLVWKRVPQPGDEYGLILSNPQDMDVAHLKRLFSRVRAAEGVSGRLLHRGSAQACEEWLEDVTHPLPSHVYARISNWFLTSKNDRESALADRCRDLWKALFCGRIDKRLTPPKGDNADIDPLAFDVWWKRQEACQGGS